MYALYFEKDQAFSYTHAGHRHDWEYVLVWVKNGELTHASFSRHGKVETLSRDRLHFDGGRKDTVKAVYHKDGRLESGAVFGTHCFRPAKQNEKAENAFGAWVTPTLVEWDHMKSDTVSNAELRRRFNEHDFGKANCSLQ